MIIIYIFAAIGVFFVAGLCWLFFLEWKESRENNKVLDKWLEEIRNVKNSEDETTKI